MVLTRWMVLTAVALTGGATAAYRMGHALGLVPAPNETHAYSIAWHRLRAIAVAIFDAEWLLEIEAMAAAGV